MYKDAATAHLDTNPMAYQINKLVVINISTLNIDLFAASGFAMSISPATAADLKSKKKK
jgi:hypothetical protein